jgi:hypothetical protein
VAGDPQQSFAFGPTAVAVHDDGDMLGNRPGGREPLLELPVCASRLFECHVGPDVLVQAKM